MSTSLQKKKPEKLQNHNIFWNQKRTVVTELPRSSKDRQTPSKKIVQDIYLPMAQDERNWWPVPYKWVTRIQLKFLKGC